MKFERKAEFWKILHSYTLGEGSKVLNATTDKKVKKLSLPI